MNNLVLSYSNVGQTQIARFILRWHTYDNYNQ